MAGFIAPILSGITGLAGLFGGGQQQKTTTQGTTSQTGTSNTNNTTTPNLSPIQQQLVNMFTQGAQNLYNQGPTDLSGYTAGGLQQINNSSNIANKTLSNTLAARGLSYSPAAANALTANESNRVNQSASFLQQIPLLQRQLQQQNIQGLTSAFQALPTAVTSTGSGTTNTTGTTNQTQTVNGNPIAGGLSGLGSGIAATLPDWTKLFGGGGGGSNGNQGSGSNTSDGV